ncbi:MAG TPA: hypothetical protein VEI54_10850 [Candidatus Limnocylindrales bacterium]|nr:hypothetical protein [Candidatus Limnocylindrales bacterium]
MPDWRTYVRANLGSLSMRRAEEQQVVCELAEHLEEHCLMLCANGSPEEVAIAKTCAQAGDWEELRRGIVSAKQEGNMQERVKQIWIPGLATLFSSYILLAVLQWAGTRPWISHPGEPRQIFFYTPWLMALPFIGAAGAYLSRRANGARWQVYFAASLPVLALGAFFLLLIPLMFVTDRQVPLSVKGTAFLALMANWIILPGAALCIGVALQRLLNRKTIVN